MSAQRNSIKRHKLDEEGRLGSVALWRDALESLWGNDNGGFPGASETQLL